MDFHVLRLEHNRLISIRQISKLYAKSRRPAGVSEKVRLKMLTFAEFDSGTAFAGRGPNPEPI